MTQPVVPPTPLPDDAALMDPDKVSRYITGSRSAAPAVEGVRMIIDALFE